jgi:hypothetical protein
MGNTRAVNKQVDKQKLVWAKLEAASKLLHAAIKLELSIEQRRIADALAASRIDGYFPSDATLTHDPLGANIERVVDELDSLSD